MKRILICVLAMTLCFAMCACDSSDLSVPNALLELEVQDYLYENDFDGTYSFQASHNYDKESCTDRVELTIRIPYKYGEIVIPGSCVYVYDKSSGTWEHIRTSPWGDEDYWFDEDEIEKTFTGEVRFADGNYTVTIHNIDQENKTVDCSFDITAITSAWFTSETHHAEGREIFSYEYGAFSIADGSVSFVIYMTPERGVSVNCFDN